MTSPKRHAVYAAVIGFIAAMVTWSVASADVTVVRHVKFGGFMGMGASESDTTTYIQGLKKRHESSMKFTGSFLGSFQSLTGGAKKEVDIYRVDLGKRWKLNTHTGQYEEYPIAMPSRESEHAPPSGSERESESAHPPSKEQGDEVKVIRNEVKLEQTGHKKNINGFDCLENIITWHVVTENVRTKEHTDSLMTMTLWTTPYTAALRELKKEEADFNKAYLEKLGIKMTPEQSKELGLSVIGAAAGASRGDFEKAMGKIKGYPIATDVQWAASGEGDGDEQTAGGTNSQEEPPTEELNKAAGTLGHMLGGLFGGGDDSKKSAPEPQRKQQAGSDMKTIFQSYTEIKNINTKPLSGDMFLPPKTAAGG